MIVMQRSKRVRLAVGAAILASAAMISLWLSRPSGAITFKESRESQYNSIFISSNGPYISMMFGHNRKLYTESVANTNDEKELPVEYTRYMTVALAYRPDFERILEIGLGGGSTAWYIHKTFPQSTITVVELDPIVVELAQKYFFIKPVENFQIEVLDGRMFLTRTTSKYDIIMIDAYRGPFVPFHLLTKEFFQKAKERLSPGGIVAQNVEPTTMLYDSAITTIASVFENVEIYRASGNYVAIAYDGPRKSAEELEKRAKQIDQSFQPRYPITIMVGERTFPEKNSGKVMTDDFAPVEMLNATQRHNRRLP